MFPNQRKEFFDAITTLRVTRKMSGGQHDFAAHD